MRRVTYSMNISVDGFIEDRHGSLDWSVPSAEVFRTHLDELRGVDVHLMGRRLYETMLYWETADEEPGLSDDEREWTRLWNALPKVVFSTTLTEVQASNTRLATGNLADEIARLREEGEDDIAIGGADLAAQAAALGLIDEYRIMVQPVLLGAGRPYFAPVDATVRLTLLNVRTYDNGAARWRYGVQR